MVHLSAFVARTYGSKSKNVRVKAIDDICVSNFILPGKTGADMLAQTPRSCA